MGGLGLGLIYLPAIVSVGFYFETRRALATGISVCGSGVGAFVMAPVASHLVQSYGWQVTNLVLGGICLSCLLFGGLMRPLGKYSLISLRIKDTLNDSYSYR